MKFFVDILLNCYVDINNCEPTGEKGMKYFRAFPGDGCIADLIKKKKRAKQEIGAFIRYESVDSNLGVGRPYADPGHFDNRHGCGRHR